jgi:hypothetical protein
MSFLPFVSLVLDCPMDIMMNLTSCSSEKLLLVSVGTLTLGPHFRDLIRDITGTLKVSHKNVRLYLIGQEKYV